MDDPRKISIQDFTYHLPESKIAFAPLEKRDDSKLLIYKNDSIQADKFTNVTDYLPKESLLVFNNTKVINARIKFTKSTGGVIEIFCLEPAEAISEYSTVMNQTGSARWKCLVGGVSKWKQPFIEKEIEIGNLSVTLTAKIVGTLKDVFLIDFSWQPAAYSFAEIIEKAGVVPLPPYIKREVEKDDSSRYQTIYASNEGSVAAPTAGLHFTESIFEKLKQKNIQSGFVTLQVGAGTFKPVKAAVMNDHEMHAEWIEVSREAIEAILKKKDNVFAVGTTSLRTIESIYWLGVKAKIYPEENKLGLGQWDVYSEPLSGTSFTLEESLNALLGWLQLRNKEQIFTQTQLLITPGYSFKVAKGLITNFHQPQSTLLLLVATATKNRWRDLYDYALENDFRFLSYGDANLIFMAGS